MKKSLRRNGRARTSCLRFALAEGSSLRTKLSRSFLRELARVDSGLELHWNPGRGRWILYRLQRKGVTPSEDRMLKEFELVGPKGEHRSPGQWLIDWLRKNDKTRGGALCPEYADRRYLEKIDFEPKREKELRERASWEHTEAIAHDIENYVINSRTSQALPKGTSELFSKSRKKGGRDH